MIREVESRSGMKLLTEDRSHWEACRRSGFGPPAIGSEGVRTKLELNPNRAFVLHRTDLRFNEVARRWQARLRSAQGVKIDSLLHVERVAR
jgi:hypothetical protein